MIKSEGHHWNIVISQTALDSARDQHIDAVALGMATDAFIALGDVKSPGTLGAVQRIACTKGRLHRQKVHRPHWMLKYRNLLIIVKHPDGNGKRGTLILADVSRRNGDTYDPCRLEAVIRAVTEEVKRETAKAQETA